MKRSFVVVISAFTVFMFCLEAFYLIRSIANSDIPDKKGLETDVIRQRRIDAKCQDFKIDDIFLKIMPSFEEVAPKKRSIIMLLSSELKPEEVDYYYIATLVSVYRLAKHPSYKVTEDTEVNVLVTQSVGEEKVNELIYAGARVFVVNSITPPDNRFINPGWKNCFTKLFIFNMYFFEYIAYIDGDVLITRSLTEKQDSIFKCLEEEKKKNPLAYVFGATRDVGLDPKTFNAGVMLFQPNCDMYKEVFKIIPQTHLYNYGFLEQGLLNYVFHPDKPIFGTKWTFMPYKYNSHWLKNYPSISTDGLAIVHDKFWHNKDGWRNPRIQQLWWDAVEETKLWQLNERGNTSINVNKQHILDSLKE